MDSNILSFRNIGDKTVYNPTIPFAHNNKEYIGVRTESFDGELDSKICFAYKNQDHWIIDYALPSFQLQDPALTIVKENILLSGVHVEKNQDGSLKWRTDFYLGPDISKLKKIASGPWSMKDIRVVEMDGYVGVFTRPMNKEYGKGKIGFLKVKNIEELKDFSEDQWYKAVIIKDIFDQNQWGGVNQAIRLPESKSIGVIGHVAHKTINEKGKLQKHYRAMSFIFNPETLNHSEMKIIATRNDFPKTISKRSPELDDVIFPAGIDALGYLYCGLSDCCIGRIKIKNPLEIGFIF